MTDERTSARAPWKALGLVALGLAAGAGGTLLLRPAPKGAAETPAPKKQMYQCPMHPQIIQDHPGDCPICGMALVPMDGEGAASGLDSHAVVKIDPERQQLIGLRTEAAVEGPVGGTWRALGRVTPDETRIRKVTVKVEGFVEKLFVDFTGRTVAKGEPLFTFYSPEFVSAQKEYLLALRTRKALEGGSLQGTGGDLL